jgi:putative DNA primase/helicase
MVQGCLQWQRAGLNPPEAVRVATAEYFEAENVLNAWIEEECETDKNGWERIGDLYNSFRAYAERSGEEAGSKKAFSQSLEGDGLVRTKTNRGRGYNGLKLKLHVATTDFG